MRFHLRVSMSIVGPESFVIGGKQQLRNESLHVWSFAYIYRRYKDAMSSIRRMSVWGPISIQEGLSGMSFPWRMVAEHPMAVKPRIHASPSIPESRNTSDQLRRSQPKALATVHRTCVLRSTSARTSVCNPPYFLVSIPVCGLDRTNVA
jgi:hypothetical protein